MTSEGASATIEAPFFLGFKKFNLLPISFFLNPDPVDAARRLIGKYLIYKPKNGKVFVGGFITETEAYGGAEDKACHGYGNRITPRTQTLFEQGGISYVYLCYGMHALLNVVTGPKGAPMATLIRGMQIVTGIETAKNNRSKMIQRHPHTLAVGPGNVTKALGVTLKDNAQPLNQNRFFIFETNWKCKREWMEIGPRVGVDYAGDWAKKPWRFQLPHTHWKHLPQVMER